MQIKGTAKFIRMSPRKIRLTVDLVRGLNVDEALNQLRFSGKLAARPVIKLIKSAIAGAEHNYGLAKDNLLVKSINVNEGPAIKRWMQKAFGRATPIYKRMSHIHVTLGEIIDSGIVKPKKHKIAAAIKIGKKTKNEVKDNKPTEEKEIKTEKQIAQSPHEDHVKHGKDAPTRSKGFAKKLFQRKAG